MIGHFLSICLFVFAIILIPKQTNELIGLMDMQKVYQRAKYKSNKKTEHLVLTGFLNTLDLKNFFKELYHQDHGKKEIISVILEKRNMSQDMSSLLNSLDQANYIKYLQGSPFFEKDLVRTSLKNAEACVIMSEKYLEDPYFVDYSNIFTFLSIQKYIDSLENKVINLPIIIQLIKAENKKYFHAIADTKDQSSYNVIVGIFIIFNIIFLRLKLILLH